MNKLTLIIGGAKSGKSTYALDLARQRGGAVVFVATAEPVDAEMEARIARHRRERPAGWVTIEEPRNLPACLEHLKPVPDCIIIDCLTIYISNLLLDGLEEDTIEQGITAVLNRLKTMPGQALIVSNEVGLGIVPDNALGRKFRDLAGRINQQVARHADAVIYTVAGLPVTIKGA